MYHSILVGQDASESSRQALETAIWLAGATRARLTLIHLHGRKLPLAKPAPIADVREQLERGRARCDEAGVACRAKVVEGWTTQALVGEARWYDLVVVAKHGEGRRHREPGVGSVPRALLASSPVPVLLAAEVAPDATPDPDGSGLLVVFDESPDACRALRIGAALAAERGLRLHAVEARAADREPAALARVEEVLADVPGLQSDVQWLDGKTAPAVLDYVRAHRVRLTFLPALDRTVFGPHLAERVATETDSAVVVPQGRTPPIY